MRMARVNVYMPAELVEEARAAGVNVSNVAQQALRRELFRRRAGDWLDRVRRFPRTTVAHDEAMAAVDVARSELGS
jgi:post-segregation antitoxin (ccd killing protein)